MDQHELDQLKADLQRMQARIDELEATSEQPVSRRHMLRGLSAAAVGAAAGGLAFARPAAAADNDNLVIGNSTQTANSPTVLLKDASYSASPSVGMFHVTDSASASDSSVGVVSCISAAATNNGFTTAFSGKGSSYGAKLDAPTPLKLLDTAGTAAPATGGSGYTGQFRINDGTLYMCVDHTGLFGTDAEWRRITGPGVAGGFHAVTPGRVYDSRWADGALSSGNNRTISVADRKNLSGTTDLSNFVPAGAKAITANVTVVTVSGGGFLVANPGGTTTVGAATVNWTAAGQILNNGVALTLNTSRQLTIVAGGGGSTNFVIDVTGYYL